MTHRDFFKIIIRMIALFVFLSSFLTGVSYNVVAFAEYVDTTGILITASVVLVLLGVLIMILRNPDPIIDFFKLDQGYSNERVKLSLEDSTALIKLGITAIGMYFIVINISNVLFSVIDFFVIKSSFGQIEGMEYSYFGLNIIEIVIGASFIALRDKIAGLFESKSEPEEL
ncbi:MAG: hypothetical protein N4A46_02440 [Schleiferiaceae bacterium]|jgi:hypothetical protein|nr:hypothetical protein [Schleiferiaceae bacterium]